MPCNGRQEAFTINAAMKIARKEILLTIIAATLCASACGRKHRRVATTRAPQPQAAKPAPVGTTEQGIASWYGVPYHGRPAADGEIYDMEKLVAAHRTMPFNTWLRVTNLNNQLSVDVRVIDRGPFIDGRIIDLSKAAARQIQMLGTGIAPVRIEVIGAPADVPSSDFYAVQVGAFSVYENAEHLRLSFAQRYGTAQLAIKQGKIPLYRVLVGKVPSQRAAEQLSDQLRGEVNHDVFIVRLDSSIVPAPIPPPAESLHPVSAPAPVVATPSAANPLYR